MHIHFEKNIGINKRNKRDLIKIEILNNTIYEIQTYKKLKNEKNYFTITYNLNLFMR